jgi:hypothetical protein
MFFGPRPGCHMAAHVNLLKVTMSKNTNPAATAAAASNTGANPAGLPPCSDSLQDECRNAMNKHLLSVRSAIETGRHFEPHYAFGYGSAVDIRKIDGTSQETKEECVRNASCQVKWSNPDYVIFASTGWQMPPMSDEEFFAYQRRHGSIRNHPKATFIMQFLVETKSGKHLLVAPIAKRPPSTKRTKVGAGEWMDASGSEGIFCGVMQP